MEKLGVQLDPDKVKTAQQTGTCPSCQSNLVGQDPPQCGTCGTKPFEKKNGAKIKHSEEDHTLGCTERCVPVDTIQDFHMNGG